jgi:hypothetical protein
MSLQIGKTTLPYSEQQLAEYVNTYKQQLANHKKTVGVAAPWPHDELVRTIVQTYNGDYTVVNDSDWQTHEVPPPPPLSWNDIRMQRNSLLLGSDWTQLPDVRIANKEAWENYRQQLRDITTKYPTPESVVWPVAPSV